MRFDIILKNFRLAFSKSPMELKGQEILDEIETADHQRGLGVLASLTRGSVLMQLEQVFFGSDHPDSKNK